MVGENLYFIKTKVSEGECDNVGKLEGGGAKLLVLVESAPRGGTQWIRREAQTLRVSAQSGELEGLEVHGENSKRRSKKNARMSSEKNLKVLQK